MAIQGRNKRRVFQPIQPFEAYKSPACSARFLTACLSPPSLENPPVHLPLCFQLPFTMARGNKQFQCPECSTRVSRQKDLQRHMMLHSKSEQQ
ncbi:uncharacterized protein BT62DRAFT_926103 [Guyanagaster necrorhizus]|uniref:C2H2-type domain-containing protein n=1 Tax=Guyanagaster necrorhizus TaxID=856835 RepID=A0A9P8AXZ1_9AGAR|nr:uncharacterized protein BT62DRAFT_926103 [Guyanagaster necrorhizus MCA 3950]KAG7451910.1 hypothetical protein BT62DRAFT_926103 [Guyanagaster necrorhizus MCA 3950]